MIIFTFHHRQQQAKISEVGARALAIRPSRWGISAKGACSPHKAPGNFRYWQFVLGMQQITNSCVVVDVGWCKIITDITINPTSFHGLMKIHQIFVGKKHTTIQAWSEFGILCHPVVLDAFCQWSSTAGCATHLGSFSGGWLASDGSSWAGSSLPNPRCLTWNGSDLSFRVSHSEKVLCIVWCFLHFFFSCHMSLWSMQFNLLNVSCLGQSLPNSGHLQSAGLLEEVRQKTQRQTGSKFNIWPHDGIHAWMHGCMDDWVICFFFLRFSRNAKFTADELLETAATFKVFHWGKGNDGKLRSEERLKGLGLSIL